MQIGSIYHFDTLVFIFKDCDSFTKVFQFLVEVKEVIDTTDNHHVKEYWSNVKKIYLVYTDFEETIPVDCEQLFPILN